MTSILVIFGHDHVKPHVGRPLLSLSQARLHPRLSGAALSQKVGVHDPPLPRLGFGPHPLDIVHDVAEITRHENFVLGADIGTPINVTL